MLVKSKKQKDRISLIVPDSFKIAQKRGLVEGIIFFGSYTYSLNPSDIDVAVITSVGKYDDFVEFICKFKDFSKYDISLIKSEEISRIRSFYFGGHGKYLVEALREGVTVLGINPFKNLPQTKELEIRQSIFERMKEYIYVLRKSYFDDSAYAVFLKRYNKVIKLSAYLLLDNYNYPRVLHCRSDILLKELSLSGITLNFDKRRNVEMLWKKLCEEYEK